MYYDLVSKIFWMLLFGTIIFRNYLYLNVYTDFVSYRDRYGIVAIGLLVRIYRLPVTFGNIISSGKLCLAVVKNRSDVGSSRLCYEY
jgi:hypothetical protein